MYTSLWYGRMFLPPSDALMPLRDQVVYLSVYLCVHTHTHTHTHTHIGGVKVPCSY